MSTCKEDIPQSLQQPQQDITQSLSLGQNMSHIYMCSQLIYAFKEYIDLHINICSKQLLPNMLYFIKIMRFVTFL